MHSVIKSNRKYNNKKYNKRYKKSKLKNKRKKYSSSKYKNKNIRKKTKRRRTVLKGGVVEGFRCTEVPGGFDKQIKYYNFNELLSGVFGTKFNEDRFNAIQGNNEDRMEASNRLSLKIIDELEENKLGSGNFGYVVSMPEDEGEGEVAVKLYKIPSESTNVESIFKGVTSSPVDPFTYLYILREKIKTKEPGLKEYYESDNKRYDEILNEVEIMKELKELKELKGIEGICEFKHLVVLTDDTGTLNIVAGFAMEKLEGPDLTNYKLDEENNFQLVVSVKKLASMFDKQIVSKNTEETTPEVLTLTKFVKELIKIMDAVFEKGYVHNDLHARNILISGTIVYLIDWGLAGLKGEQYVKKRAPGNLGLSINTRAEDVCCLIQLIIELIRGEKLVFGLDYLEPGVNQHNKPLENKFGYAEIVNSGRNEIVIINERVEYLKSELGKNEAKLPVNVNSFLKKILEKDYLVSLYEEDKSKLVGGATTLTKLFEQSNPTSP